jgi:hypothetical protein
MLMEANMTPNDDNPEERKKKKYLWFGYGSYGGIGDLNAFQPVNIRADPGIFDRLFELFGVKEKPEKQRQEDEE